MKSKIAEQALLSTMSKEQARSHSRNAIDTGYAAWIVSEIKERANIKFASSDPKDAEALKDARMLYSAAAMVDSVIRDNAR